MLKKTICCIHINRRNLKEMGKLVLPYFLITLTHTKIFLETNLF